jgi:dipeptidyl aminopeptidase/acylaminoacyl peptidase
MPSTRPPGRALVAFALTLVLAAPAFAQQGIVQTGTPADSATKRADPKVKRSLAIADYSRWRSIDGAQISPDGKWVAYVQRFTNVVTTDQKPELRLIDLTTNKDTVILQATNPQFSPDSRWVVYQVEIPPPPPPRGAGRPGAQSDSAADTSAAARARRANEPPPRRTELRDLATGKTQHWADVATATFSATSTHLLMRRRPPTPAGAGAGASAGPGAPGGPPAGPGGGGAGPGASAAASMRGLDAVLHELSTGRSHFLGSVGDASFNRRGDLLSYTVEAAVKDGNGLFVVDLATNRTHVLDNDGKTYSRLTWNDDGTGIAVLKAREVQRMRERDNILVAIPNVRATFVAAAAPKPVTLDTTASGFPKKFVISDRATLSWSDDNKRVFFGIIGQASAPDTSRRRSADSVADVDVWRTQDERVQSLQMIRADAERNFTFRQALEVATGRFIALTDSSMREIEIAPDGRWGVGRDARPYIADYGRQRADYYRVNTSTGERTPMLKAQQFGVGISADSKHFLYWNDEKWQDYDLDAGTSKTLGAGAPSFVNLEFEYPGPKPPYGIAGFSADGRGVIAQHRFDLWYLPYQGSNVRNLTGDGTRNEIQFRIVRTVPADPTAPRAARDQRLIDLAKPVTLSAYGEFSKKSGFYQLAGGKVTPIVYEHAIFTTPVRAARAEQYLFTRQSFVEFPDVRLSSGAFGVSRRISDANPQQNDFIWGRRVLFDYQNRDGKRLQGVLALPDDYKDGEKRPMLVTFYERNSQNMHRHTPPSFLGGMGQLPIEAVSRGYITMMPDVFFRTGSSHSDMLEAVEAATKKVIELGYADPKRIGVHGHSYGGEGAAFIGTQSRMFAAVGMGAGVTDLFSDFAQSWGWSYQVNSGSGANAFDYYLNGQGRWGVSPWEKPELYRFESALTHAPNVSQPILIMHGTADPTVAFSEGHNFYQALRFNKKEAYLLAYPGEGHGLRGLANRKDLTIRYFQFFDHYLKGAPAPKWMTEGVPFLVKETVKEPK